jgi:ATP-dependent DNA helicase DinG
MTTVLEYFPEEFKPREIQKEILQGIEQQLKSGYKTIILSAPTGVGKSLIAATLARYHGSSFIVTASKQLQDQYSKDAKISFMVQITNINKVVTGLWTVYQKRRRLGGYVCT